MRWTIQFVLILIILEYIYIMIVDNVTIATSCLNPYYTGIHLHTTSANAWKITSVS